MTGPTRADGTPIEVLLVEDDPGDVLMTQEAFEEHKVRNRLTVVSDGAEALAYLRREGEYADAVRPDLILLDLNLPRRDGREVLEEIKNDDDLGRIPQGDHRPLLRDRPFDAYHLRVAGGDVRDVGERHIRRDLLFQRQARLRIVLHARK